MSWRTAKALDVLLAEINAIWPKRDKASDGAIGNAEHAARASDHNPDGNGVVRARDYDKDLGEPSDVTMEDIAEHVRLLGAAGDARLVGGKANGYVIFEKRIAGAGKGWAWRPYTGVNAHEHHMHVSVCSKPSGYDSKATWGIDKLGAHVAPEPATGEDDDMIRIYDLTFDTEATQYVRIGNCIRTITGEEKAELLEIKPLDVVEVKVFGPRAWHAITALCRD